MMPIVQRMAIFATKPMMSRIRPRIITEVSYSRITLGMPNCSQKGRSNALREANSAALGPKLTERADAAGLQDSTHNQR
jgi:hypothetical protein